MRPSPRKSLPAIIAVAAAGLWAGTAAASQASWTFVPRIEHSNVTVNGRDGQWDTWSVGVGRAVGMGHVEGSLARQDRNGLVDDELQMSAGARLGAWDTTATVQVAPDAIFLPEWGYEVQAERSAGTNRRAGVGVRRLNFRDSSVNLAAAHLTFYRGDDELGVEYRMGRNAVLDHDIRVLQLRGTALRGRNQFGVYVARGDYLFNALGIRGGDGSGWSANVAYARVLTPSTRLRFELGAGGETDTFRQRSVAVSLQYRP